MKRQINTRWVMLVILLGLIMAIASCSGKKKPTSAEAIPSETQPTVTSPGHEMTEEALAEKHRKEEMEKLKNTAMQKFVNEDVFFDFDDAYLRPDAQEILKKKVEWLKANPTVSVTIEGHCDERGSEAYNIALGNRRAQNIRTFLIDAGISGDRLQTISYGSEKPIDPGHDEAAWARNRRGHFHID